MGRSLALGLLLLVVACSRTNPFWIHKPEPEKDAVMLDLPDRAGIVVLPITGLAGNQEAALTSAIVDALQGANIPAETGVHAGNRASRFLSTGVRQEVDDTNVRIDIRWSLLDHDKTLIGNGRAVREVPTSAWDDGATDTMQSIARGIAPEIAGLIQHDMGTDTSVAVESVFLSEIADVPGDGARVLPPLINFLLKKNGYGVPDSGDGAIVIRGAYTAEPAPNGMEKVAFSWHVDDPTGAEIGVVNQENVVPRGSLDGKWGDAAFFIAEGAVQGIHALLQARAGKTSVTN
jgi:hypothetical protein